MHRILFLALVAMFITLAPQRARADLVWFYGSNETVYCGLVYDLVRSEYLGCRIGDTIESYPEEACAAICFASPQGTHSPPTRIIEIESDGTVVD
jgi:hypothetical protein